MEPTTRWGGDWPPSGPTRIARCDCRTRPSDRNTRFWSSRWAHGRAAWRPSRLSRWTESTSPTRSNCTTAPWSRRAGWSFCSWKRRREQPSRSAGDGSRSVACFVGRGGGHPPRDGFRPSVGGHGPGFGAASFLRWRSRVAPSRRGRSLANPRLLPGGCALVAIFQFRPGPGGKRRGKRGTVGENDLARLGAGESVQLNGIRSILCVPSSLPDGEEGFLYADRLAAHRPFEELGPRPVRGLAQAVFGDRRHRGAPRTATQDHPHPPGRRRTQGGSHLHPPRERDHVGDPQGDGEGVRARCARAHPWRDRNRQGASRTFRRRFQPSGGQSVYRHQLRGDPGKPDGKRTVRPRKGARSPERERARKAGSRRPRAAPCSWTSWANCHCPCK